jgi:hypothetical protein
MPTRGVGSTLALLAGLALAVLATVAAAATLMLAGGHLGAGGTPVQRCDTDGFSYTQIVSGSSVTAVTVDNIATACAGGLLRVTLTNTAGANIGAGAVALPTTGFTGTASVPISPQQLTSAVHRYNGIVVGP